MHKRGNSLTVQIGVCKQAPHYSSDAEGRPSTVRTPGIREDLTQHSRNEIECQQSIPVELFRQWTKNSRSDSVDAALLPTGCLHEKRRHHPPPFSCPQSLPIPPKLGENLRKDKLEAGYQGRDPDYQNGHNGKRGLRL